MDYQDPVCNFRLYVSFKEFIIDDRVHEAIWKQVKGHSSPFVILDGSYNCMTSEDVLLNSFIFHFSRLLGFPSL